MAENGKSWSYKDGKLHPGCYNVITDSDDDDAFINDDDEHVITDSDY